jgi:hypothetical protein
MKDKKENDLDDQIKKAEIDKLIAEKKNIDFQRKNYWVRSIIGFFSLGGIIAFLLSYIIVPTVEIKVREAKLELLDHKEKLDSIDSELKTLDSILKILDKDMKGKEDSLAIHIYRYESAVKSNSILEKKLNEQKKLIERLNKNSTSTSSENKEKLKEFENISKQITAIESERDSLIKISIQTVCDKMVEDVFLRKDGKRYYLSLPSFHPVVSEQIGVKFSSGGGRESYIFVSEPNEIRSLTTRYNYKKSFSKKVDDYLEDNSKYTPVVRLKCNGHPFYIDLKNE